MMYNKRQQRNKRNTKAATKQKFYKRQSYENNIMLKQPKVKNDKKEKKNKIKIKRQ